MSNEYVLDIIGALHQAKSKKQINADIKQLEKVINRLRLTGTFAKGDTKKELNAYIKSLQSQLAHIIKSKKFLRKVNNMLNKDDIRQYRMLRGLSYREVSNYCNVTHTLISQIEKGERNLTLETHNEIINGINAAYDAKCKGTLKAENTRKPKTETTEETEVETEVKPETETKPKKTTKTRKPKPETK